MILVHKQQLPLSSPYPHHRRHPSAPPAVVVQPTKTPGLLSLSKPSPRQQPQQPRQRNSPKPKPAQAVRSPKQVQVAALEVNSVLKPSPEILDKKQSLQAGSRGRQQAKPKEKPTTRSSSHSAVRGRRNNSRQQSPPLPSQLSSQAEAPPSPTYVSSNSNLFDPFLDDSTPNNSQFKPVRPTPTLTSRPSGKLARRRQPNLAPFNPTLATTPSRAIPVPRRFNSYASDLSRSDPVPTRKVGSKSNADVFPICDDMTDSSDSEDDSTPPATPTRARPHKKSYDDGPRTAPIATPMPSFPFAAPPAPGSVGRKVGRKHRRVPSEGVFVMSSDEEVAHTSSYKGPNSDDLKALFGLTFKRQSMKSMSYESEKEREAAAAAAGYFASSNFQNSPSPEDLPPPSFA